jgi:hypothetical protein
MMKPRETEVAWQPLMYFCTGKIGKDVHGEAWSTGHTNDLYEAKKSRQKGWRTPVGRQKLSTRRGSGRAIRG